MNKLLAFVHLDDPASLKRAVGAGLAGLVVLLTPMLAKYGIPVPTDAMVLAFAAIVTGWVLQSGVRSAVEAHVAGKVEAAKIATVSQADNVLLQQIAKQAAEDASEAPTPSVTINNNVQP